MAVERDHALLSPSSAERWLACPPSARLNDKYEDPSSAYAEEGTLAHSFGEVLLKAALKQISPQKKGADLKKLRRHELYYKGMEDEVQEYVDYVLAEYEAALEADPAAEIFIEQKLDLSRFAPESFGTGDAVILCKDHVHVIDLKFGRGIAVEADDNPQLKLYGLGAAEEFGFLHDITEIRVTIAQVRLGNMLTFNAPANEVYAWGEEFVRPIAELAFAGGGEFQVGEHCRFCLHGAVCKPRAKHYEDAYDRAREIELSHEEIARYLTLIKDMVRWADTLKENALQMALAGEEIPQWKVVEGRSNRRVTNEPEAARVLKAEGLTDEEIYKLRGITELERRVGKKRFAEITQLYIEKPQGKPTLAPATDKRPAIDLISDGLDFDN
ncbi:MAG: DUF2800 domain-containing protein [Clostridiaceae bacterium]|nr:DUF2800 domain-containing protein [Clostridiaceae bacterium]